MAQRGLPYEYELEEGKSGLTAMGGLPTYLGDSWITKRMKAIRFGLINIAGRVMDHARRLLVRISENHPSGRLLIEARQRIALLRESSG